MNMQPDVLIPLLCIGLFFVLILGFFFWFFIAMNRDDAKGEARQTKIYKSRFLKFLARSYGRRGGRSRFFPNSFGGRLWK